MPSARKHHHPLLSDQIGTTSKHFQRSFGISLITWEFDFRLLHVQCLDLFPRCAEALLARWDSSECSSIATVHSLYGRPQRASAMLKTAMHLQYCSRKSNNRERSRTEACWKLCICELFAGLACALWDCMMTSRPRFGRS